MHKLEHVLQQLIARHSGSRQIAEARLRIGLKSVLGPELASACEEIEVRGTTVVVTTSNPALAHQLRLDSVELLRRLNRESRLQPPLRLLKLRVGRFARP